MGRQSLSPYDVYLEDTSRGMTYFGPHGCEEIDTGVASYLATETLLVYVSVVALTPTGCTVRLTCL